MAVDWSQFKVIGKPDEEAVDWSQFKPLPSIDEEAQKSNIGEMNYGEKLAVGVGRGMNDVGQGLKQMGLQIAEGYENAPAWKKALLAMTNPGLALNASMTSKQQEKGALPSSEKYTADVQDELASYEPLREDSPYLTGTGRIAGNILAAPVPSGTASTLLGKVGLAALSGGAQGAAQFVPEGGSRLENTALGASVGAAIPVFLQGGELAIGAVQGFADKLKSLLPPMTVEAREAIAAKVLRDVAADPAKLAQAGANTQLVPGTQQSLAEATDDVGISGLQQTLRNMSPDFNNKLFAQAQGNNAARVEAIKSAFGGASESAAQKAELARDAATAPLLKSSYKGAGVDTKPVIKIIDDIIEKRKGRPAVQAAVQKIKDLLQTTDDDSVRVTHNVRQTIGDMLSGSAGAESDAARAAARELMAVKTRLDAQIGKASPDFRKWLAQYAAMSKEAGRVRLGEELLGKKMATLDSTGNPVLSPAQFARASDNLDRVAKTATGFRKETAERLMTQPQKDTVAAIRADLDRFARSQSQGAPIKSDTARNLIGAGKIEEAVTGGGEIQSAMLPGLTLAKNLFNKINRNYGEKTLGIVREAMLNPKEAARILAVLPKSQRQRVASILQSPQAIQAAEALQKYGPLVGSAATTGEE